MKNLIVLAAITVALYGKAQCCCNIKDASKIQQYCCNTYDACNTRAIQWEQYKNFTHSSKKTCLAVMEFTKAAESLINESRAILDSTIIDIDSTTFSVTPDVSSGDTWYLCTIDNFYSSTELKYIR